MCLDKSWLQSSFEYKTISSFSNGTICYRWSRFWNNWIMVNLFYKYRFSYLPDEFMHNLKLKWRCSFLNIWFSLDSWSKESLVDSSNSVNTYDDMYNRWYHTINKDQQLVLGSISWCRLHAKTYSESAFTFYLNLIYSIISNFNTSWRLDSFLYELRCFSVSNISMQIILIEPRIYTK